MHFKIEMSTVSINLVTKCYDRKNVLLISQGTRILIFKLFLHVSLSSFFYSRFEINSKYIKLYIMHGVASYP